VYSCSSWYEGVCTLVHLGMKVCVLFFILIWRCVYSCSSWYEGICKSLRNKLQNKTVRFAKKLEPRTRINYRVFSDAGILNIENRVQQFRLNHVHKQIMSRVLNIWDNISVKREICIITQQGVNIIIVWCQM
jgi:hypothetical protein